MDALGMLRAIDDCVIRMEEAGQYLDVERCREGAALANRALEQATEGLRQWAREVDWHEERPAKVDAIWNSPLQLSVFLHSDIGLGLPPSPIAAKGPVPRGKVSTDKVALGYLSAHHPKARAGLELLLKRRRTISSLKYLEKLPLFTDPAGYIHPTYGPAGDNDGRPGAVTGRLAAKNPELMQIPGADEFRIRRALTAGPPELGCTLIEADYTALEVVILAHLLIQLFDDDQLAKETQPGAIDFHSVRAAQVFTRLGVLDRDECRRHLLASPGASLSDHPNPRYRWARKAVKTVWYGLQYGKSERGFGATLLTEAGDPVGEATARNIVRGLLGSLPGLSKFHAHVRRLVGRDAGIPSIGGRWCDLQALTSTGSRKDFERAYRRALNFPLQASGADIVGVAMVAVDNDPRLARMGWRLQHQEHDALVLRGPRESAEEARAIVKRAMETVPVDTYRLRVTLSVVAKIGDNREETK